VSKYQADRRSIAGLNEVAWEWKSDSVYAEIWGVLYGKGRIAPGPEHGRNVMTQTVTSAPVTATGTL
jgi:hypothetical protein